ncbi:MAG: hypothetical protein CL431_00525 [Acidimicrobiaceae bacterium]|jgi:hypothetical protein|nr:hypothetical protein [Acidimicrobiaceae bacterium]|tara:strand:+ start:42611 stop:43117 length:507 start_codon:yes stop_codon:yes gene_type:complete
MLLIALAILWLGAGVYWLRNRITAPSFALRNTTNRFRTPRRAKAVVVPLHTSQQYLGSGLQPGHSLVEPPLDVREKGINPMELTSEQARIRRRKVLLALGGTVVFTLLLAVVAGGGFIALHFFADALLFLYVWALVQYQREIEQTRRAILQPSGSATLDFAATGTDRI